MSGRIPLARIFAFNGAFALASVRASVWS